MGIMLYFLYCTLNKDLTNKEETEKFFFLLYQSCITGLKEKQAMFRMKPDVHKLIKVTSSNA